MNGKTAERVYGRLVTLSNTSIRLDSAIVKARVSDRVYTGSEQKPKPTVVAAGSVLKEGTDCTLSYSNNVKGGTASVTIRGKGNYSGSVTKTFKIYKDTFKTGTYMETSALKSNLVMDVVDGSTSAGQVFSCIPPTAPTRKDTTSKKPVMGTMRFRTLSRICI